MNGSPGKSRSGNNHFGLLIVMAVVGVLCTLLAMKVREAERQKAAIAWVLKAGGSVLYSYERDFVDEDGNPAGHYDQNGSWTSDAEPPGPNWVRELFGDDFLRTVVEVDLPANAVTDLTPLKSFPNLDELCLSVSSVPKLSSSLKKLNGLKRLNLWIDIDWDANWANEIAELRKGLPNCRVRAYGGI